MHVVCIIRQSMNRIFFLFVYDVCGTVQQYWCGKVLSWLSPKESATRTTR